MDALTSSLGLGGLSGNSTLSMPVALDEGMDRQSCALLGSTGLIVQGLMAAMVLSTLLLKRLKEHPKRTWPVWTADVGKQIIGQGYLHASNVLISTLVSHHERRDACTAYFLSILVDCTLGVLVIFATLRIISYILITRLHLSGFRSGQYYENSIEKPRRHNGDLEAEEDEEEAVHSQSETQQTHFQFSWWGKQTLIYLASLTTMKLTILGFFWIPQIFTVGDWVLSWMSENVKVVFVLMIFPLIMNAFQFLIIDTILKSPHHKPPSSAFANDGSKQEDTSNSRNRDHDGDDDENQAFLGRADDVAAEEGESLLAGDHARTAGAAKGGEVLPTYRQTSSTRPATTRHNSGKEQAANAGLSPPSKSSSVLIVSPTQTLPQLNSFQQVPQPALPPSVPSRNLMPEDEKEDEQGWDWLDEDEDSINKEDASDVERHVPSRIQHSSSNNEKSGIDANRRSSNFVPVA